MTLLGLTDSLSRSNFTMILCYLFSSNVICVCSQVCTFFRQGHLSLNCSSKLITCYFFVMKYVIDFREINNCEQCVLVPICILNIPQEFFMHNFSTFQILFCKTPVILCIKCIAVYDQEQNICLKFCMELCQMAFGILVRTWHLVKLQFIFSIISSRS